MSNRDLGRMATQTSTFSRNLTVPLEASRLAEIRRFVEAACNCANLDPERTFDLKVAVSEACANAVEHSGDAGSPLKVRARCRAGRLTVEIYDHGGFHPPYSANGSQRDHRLLGIPLMIALTDEVRITKLRSGGTRVTLSVELRERSLVTQEKPRALPSLSAR